MKKNNGILIVILFYSFVFLSLFFYFNTSASLVKINNLGDSYAIIKAAQKFYFNFRFDSERTFLYPVIIGFPLLFGTGNVFLFYYILVLQYLFGVAGIILLFLILKVYVNKTMTVIACFVYSLSISNHIYSFYALTEPPFILVLLFSLYMLQRFIQEGSILKLMISVLFLFISAVIRPVTLPLCIIIFIAWIIYFVIINNIRKSKIHLVSFFFIITLGIQITGMYKDYNRLDFSFAGKKTVFKYLLSLSESLRTNEPIENIQYNKEKRLQQITDKLSLADSLNAINNIINKNIKNEIFGNFNNVIRAYLYSVYSNSTGGIQLYNVKIYNDIYKLSVIQNIFFTLIFALNIVILFFILIFKKFRGNIKKEVIMILLFCAVLNMSDWLMSGLAYWQGDRYNIVMVPFTIIISSIMIHLFKLKKLNQ
ncbi:MAG TPA: hypothetical protein PKK00_00780 [Bacteroidales bacterium]|nr:hypothetical protein [Bacteroidales bacterium]HPS15957.1 hypothetical protein [Bacteroidales bacterium]